jgi:hypothetical protein
LDIILMKMHWRMEKVASQEMLLFYSDAEGCCGIDFHQNLSFLACWKCESSLKVGEDRSRAEELWMFPSLATTRPLSEPGKRINNNLKRLVALLRLPSQLQPLSLSLSLNHTSESFRIGAMSQIFAPSCNMSKRCRCCFRT